MALRPLSSIVLLPTSTFSSLASRYAHRRAYVEFLKLPGVAAILLLLESAGKRSGRDIIFSLSSRGPSTTGHIDSDLPPRLEKASSIQETRRAILSQVLRLFIGH
ncbi:hypothetical protein CVT26_005623 [Gymnopilus dilepis]|uniref:Uncharacterized protein n=1 Tax=Gymnopilus dilepis TaxID=231916 RepID=A0A409XZK7_9AGAR|nr:hypothetical protein CVT26_005623 [Gymnopilus dilepis]